MGRRKRGKPTQTTPFVSYPIRVNRHKNPPIGVQVYFRATTSGYKHVAGLARVVAHIDENDILVYNGTLWHLSRPHKAAPWKGGESNVAYYYYTAERVRIQGERYKGCGAGDPANLIVSQALVDAGLVPPLVISPPPDESLWTLGKRLAEFGQSYWSGQLPYDSREHIALLLVAKGATGAANYLLTDEHRMVVLRKERETFERACALLEAEIGHVWHEAKKQHEQQVRSRK